MHWNNETNNIISVKITGDFFIYPEESIELIEEELKNVKLDKINILKKIQSVINQNNIEMIGIDEEGLTNGILMCLK